MSITRKRQRTTVLRSRSIKTDQESFSVTTTETWEGPFTELQTQQNASSAGALSTSLSTTDGANGVLEIVRKVSLPAGNRSLPSSNQVVIEVEWVELRKKLESHPRYKDIPEAQMRMISKHIQNPDPDVSPALTNSSAQELYTKLLRGQTEYSIAVPVVRKTSYRPTSLSAGDAWKRGTPPVTIGSWQWLKTADRITKSGDDFTRVEEWTGAEEWDKDIYP